MSNKLQNVKAIKQMLSGEHKTQTRKSTYFGNINQEIQKDEMRQQILDLTKEVSELRIKVAFLEKENDRLKNI